MCGLAVFWFEAPLAPIPSCKYGMKESLRIGLLLAVVALVIQLFTGRRVV